MMRCLAVWLFCSLIVTAIWCAATQQAVQSTPIVTHVEPEVMRRAMEVSLRWAGDERAWDEAADASEVDPSHADGPQANASHADVTHADASRLAGVPIVFDDRSEFRDGASPDHDA